MGLDLSLTLSFWSRPSEYAHQLQPFRGQLSLFSW